MIENIANDPLVMMILTFALMFLLLASGIWIGIALGLVGLFLFEIFVTGNTFKIQGMLQFNLMNSSTLCTVPLFIFMGEIMMRSGAASKLYLGLTPFVRFLPGGLLHTNIAACAVFSAVSGSSLATAATIGTTAIPELLDKRSYNTRLVLGSLAAGGTLGILIPPSINMIIYGAWTNQSIGRLFIAGIIPGIILTILFMIYIALQDLVSPSLQKQKETFSLVEMLSAIPDILPSLILILVVLGTIYLGIATPTESAALGVGMSMIIAMTYKMLRWDVIRDSAFGAIQTTAMITLIIVCAQMMSMGMSMLRIPAMLSEYVSALSFSRWGIMAVICLLYMALGCVLEALSMLLLTLPVIYPIVIALNFDPIWFGVIVTIMVEMGQITPPVGINLFIIQGVSGGRNLSDVAIGIVPFFFCQVVLVIMLFIFPFLATWLPEKMM